MVAKPQEEQVSDDKHKVIKNTKQAIANQKQSRVNELEDMLGVTVDISTIELGGLADLTNQRTSFDTRLEIIQSMLSSGDARKIKFIDLENFMEIVMLKIELYADPTST